MLELVENAVIAVAQVPAAAKVWFTRCTDRDLMDLYSWYASQMGEAPASPSS
jgi:non-ribosomal peptide synthetase component E (peptide arylation enzyme)